MTEANEPAFPSFAEVEGHIYHPTGLTKRELFALHIMAKLRVDHEHRNVSSRALGEVAVNATDALIASLNRKEAPDA